MAKRYLPHAYRLAGLVVLIALIWLTAVAPPTPSELIPGILFGALIVFADVFGVHLAGGIVSLLPMTTVAAYLVMGPVPTGWAAFIGSLVYAVLRYRWAEQLRLPRVIDRSGSVTVAAANAVAHTASVLVGGSIYEILGGEVPLGLVRPFDILLLLAFAVTYLIINHLIFLPLIATRDSSAFERHLRSLPTLMLYEGGPLVVAPLMASIYTRMGVVQFTLFALVLTVTSLITRSLAQTSRQVDRQVQELSSLQAVGRALSASLDVEDVASAIYDQVSQLMPARNFYVALYAPEVDEVSFPLAVEQGEPVQWRSRRAGSGLTEYVLSTGEPLLLRAEVTNALEELSISSIGRTAECWLGVPILAGEEAFGVIAVQSYETPEAYDVSHQAVLSTIATQAAVAIQNAHLYARTDEALARRVQELDSILRSTQEGILLLDMDWEIVAANRALAGFLGVAQLELSGHLLDPPRPSCDEPLIALLAYNPEDLRADCQILAEGEETTKQMTVTLTASGRHVERTLTPVREKKGSITGWLLVLRDVTEEIELSRLKDDTTHMLVHDLRSPLTVLGNGLALMEEAFTEDDQELFETVAAIVRQSGERMLGLVNDLLEISELESDQLELRREIVGVGPLLRETIAQFSSLAGSAQIALETSVASDLPDLYVDRGLISRVLSNLADNAIKFSPDGGRIRLWARPAQQVAPGHLLIGVDDEGPGIPQEAQERLFEKFYRVPSATDSRSGSGLGLAFCKLAVEAHGGRIWVESPASEDEPLGTGPGSTFVIALPSASADKRPD